jgi:hypothetical protein
MKHLPTTNRRDVLDCLFDGVEAADGSGIFKPDRQGDRIASRHSLWITSTTRAQNNSIALDWSWRHSVAALRFRSVLEGD